jgi:ectoine hydroxylase-related dioxygenase (phytanoyl-CoA dioxygenase family)
MLALSDFTEELGATRVAPGSNRDQTIDPATLDVGTQTVPAVMKAGDALFFTGKVIHGGGANRTTDRSRRGLTMTFSLGWLKSEEAQTLAVTRERAQKLPPRMRELCSFAGYRPYGPQVPVYSYRLEMNDPYTVIFGEERAKA